MPSMGLNMLCCCTKESPFCLLIDYWRTKSPPGPQHPHNEDIIFLTVDQAPPGYIKGTQMVGISMELGVVRHYVMGQETTLTSS